MNFFRHPILQTRQNGTQPGARKLETSMVSAPSPLKARDPRNKYPSKVDKQMTATKDEQTRSSTLNNVNQSSLPLVTLSGRSMSENVHSRGSKPLPRLPLRAILLSPIREARRRILDIPKDVLRQQQVGAIAAIARARPKSITLVPEAKVDLLGRQGENHQPKRKAPMRPARPPTLFRSSEQLSKITNGPTYQELILRSDSTLVSPSESEKMELEIQPRSEMEMENGSVILSIWKEVSFPDEHDQVPRARRPEGSSQSILSENGVIRPEHPVKVPQVPCKIVYTPDQSIPTGHRFIDLTPVKPGFSPNRRSALVFTLDVEDDIT